LVEEQRTNLLFYSSELDNAARWGRTSVSVYPNATVAPDGTLTADEVIDLNTTSASLIFQTIGSASQIATYSATVYLKAGVSTDNTCTFNVYTQGEPENNIYVDFSTGTISGGGTNLVSSNIDSVGSGWYRVTIIYNSLSSGASLLFRVWPNNRSRSGINRPNTGSVYIWGAQLEQGSFPTSYIATSGSTATRNADSAEMTGTNFSSWYRQDEGTLYSEISRVAITSDQFTWPTVRITDDNSNRSFNTFTSGSGQFFTSTDSNILLAQNNVNNLKFVIATDRLTVSADSSEISLATDDFAFSVSTTPTKLEIGRGATSTVDRSGYIKKIAYYPKRLPDATLQDLTEE